MRLTISQEILVDHYEYLEDQYEHLEKIFEEKCAAVYLLLFLPILCPLINAPSMGIFCLHMIMVNNNAFFTNCLYFLTCMLLLPIFIRIQLAIHRLFSDIHL